jgi:hypothetical protein
MVFLVTNDELTTPITTRPGAEILTRHLVVQLLKRSPIMIPAFLRSAPLGGNLTVTSAVTQFHVHKAIHHG